MRNCRICQKLIFIKIKKAANMEASSPVNRMVHNLSWELGPAKFLAYIHYKDYENVGMVKIYII